MKYNIKKHVIKKKFNFMIRKIQCIPIYDNNLNYAVHLD